MGQGRDDPLCAVPVRRAMRHPVAASVADGRAGSSKRGGWEDNRSRISAHSAQPTLAGVSNCAKFFIEYSLFPPLPSVLNRCDSNPIREEKRDMKSNHMEVLATFEETQFVVPFKEGKFPLPLALDIFLRDGWKLVSMAPHTILRSTLDDVALQFSTSSYLLVLRKIEPE